MNFNIDYVMNISKLSLDNAIKAIRLVNTLRKYKYWKEVIQLYRQLLGIRGVGKKTLNKLLQLYE